MDVLINGCSHCGILVRRNYLLFYIKVKNIFSLPIYIWNWNLSLSKKLYKIDCLKWMTLSFFFDDNKMITRLKGLCI